MYMENNTICHRAVLKYSELKRDSGGYSVVSVCEYSDVTIPSSAWQVTQTSDSGLVFALLSSALCYSALSEMVKLKHSRSIDLGLQA